MVDHCAPSQGLTPPPHAVYPPMESKHPWWLNSDSTSNQSNTDSQNSSPSNHDSNKDLTQDTNTVPTITNEQLIMALYNLKLKSQQWEEENSLYYNPSIDTVQDMNVPTINMPIWYQTIHCTKHIKWTYQSVLPSIWSFTKHWLKHFLTHTVSSITSSFCTYMEFNTQHDQNTPTYYS